MACKSIQGSFDSSGQQGSSSRRMTSKYDVFVSFRGADTRNNFTDHLFGALRRKGIQAFRDDTKLKKGESISNDLLQAIEGSQVSIVVFSKNYASSTWCLRELAKIADSIEGSGSHVLPIFYDVDPSEVRKQSGNYEKAFAKHEQRFREDSEMMVQVQKWREALTQVANLSGWDIRDRPQNAEIEKIVGHIINILGHMSSSLSNDLVGIQSPIKELERHLHLGSNNDIRMVGICGMGGIGKSTIVATLFDRISHLYDACCYIDDVNKIYRDHGSIGVQKQLLCQTLNEEKLPIYNLSKASHLIGSRLRHLRVLIVLDNVYQVEQLEKLALNHEWLAIGSRIIIISRDEHILKVYGVDEIYKVPLMNKGNAIQLFCKKAFNCSDIMIGYEQLTYGVLQYANGLPLAIKVLGCFLFGRDKSEWTSALARLRESPRSDIMDVLRISFDGLEDMEKEMFLDLACFFNNKGEAYAKKILDCCGFHSDIGIRVLVEKSLISINDNCSIYMHDLLRELGKSIVQEKSPNEPGKWSRLWCHMDFHKVMLEKTATEYIEAVVLPKYSLEDNPNNTTLKIEALSQMRHLRLLMLWNVNSSGSLNFLSNELRYLEWDRCPLTYLPSSFQLDKIVELILPQSSIEQLWKGMKPLHNLRRLDLRHSKNLTMVSDFQVVPNLESLDLEGCIKLVWIDKSIGLLQKLVSLNMKNCKNLVSIPDNIFCLSSLTFLNLSGCSKLLKNQLLEKPRHGEHLKKLDTSQSSIQRQLTSSICKILRLPLHFLYYGRHIDLVGLLLPSLARSSSLTYLDLSFCNLNQIPDAIGWLRCLVGLNIGGNNFVTVPCSIKELSKLIWLNLEHCKHLKYLPELPSVTRDNCKGGAGLYVFNCPNLSDMERCCSTAFSWMIEVVQVNMQCSVPLNLIDVVIPGSKIPRWFNKHNVGGSISLALSSIMNDNNWIGIAYCATLVAHDGSTHLDEGMEWHIMCGFQRRTRGSESGIFFNIPIHLKNDLATIESDHMLLMFFSREEFNRYVCELKKETRDLDHIELVTKLFQARHLYLEVKSCGYRLVFKEDLEQLNPTMAQRRNSSVRKRKFLAIDDDPSHNH